MAGRVLRVEIRRPGLGQAVAQELGEHGITVNVYSPGIVHTPMWDAIDDAVTSRRGTAPGSR
jgi:meso-butanediol dehydrogenase/(S,S)-butanediol dehydrogenase/diacetyl reductase